MFCIAVSRFCTIVCRIDANTCLFVELLLAQYNYMDLLMLLVALFIIAE